MALQPLPVDGRFFTRPDPLSFIKVETVTVGSKIWTVTGRDVAGRDRDGSVRSPSNVVTLRFLTRSREYHGFTYPPRVAGRVHGVGVRVQKFVPSPYPYPRDGFMGFDGFSHGFEI